MTHAVAHAASGTEPLVHTEKLCKWYGRVVGVNDFSIKVPRGVTGLLGPNGAGKSTFLKLLVGALRPSKGKLSVLGQTPWQNRALLSHIGYCPEHDGVYEDLTALEFVTTMGQLSGLDAAQATRRAAETLERLHLGDAQHRRVGEFSKGMRQRVKLAQALVHDPDLLLLDEPLTGCDPVGRAQLTKLIRELGQSGKAVIVSSHILHEVEAMTSEILLLYKGQVLAEGNIYRIREMIDEHPHQIEVRCDNPRALAREIVSDAAVSSVSFGPDADALLVQTREPDTCYPLIPRQALAAGLKIHALTSPDNNLQAVFEYLTTRHGPQGVAR